jgi:aminoglycoside phosphotransferase (APT) family kinase protein
MTERDVSDVLPAEILAELSRRSDLATGRPLACVGAAPFGDGHSGFTYVVDLADGRTAVLRLSPPGARIAGPADSGRQGLIMSALGRAGISVPAVLAHSGPGPTELVCGRAFVLTELVAGESWEEALASSPAEQIAGQAVEFLRRLRAVPLPETGIGEENQLDAHADLARWSALIPRSPAGLAVQATELYEALLAKLPASPQPPAALTHGDFHYGNMLFRNGLITAVLDWEIAALSDPRLDLGCLGVATLRRRYEPEPNPTGGLDIPLGLLADLYGMEAGTWRWILGAGCLKYAAILGYNLGLHRAGKKIDPIYEELTGTMRGLATDGLAIVRGSSDIW